MKKLAFWILLISLLFPGCSTSTAPVRYRDLNGRHKNVRSVDSEIARLMMAAKVPGLALAIINDGKIVYEKAYGWADVESGSPLRTDTIMYGASLTKAAFAYLVMELVDEGKIDLNQPMTRQLARPLPEYEDYADLVNDDRWKQVTPRMLLSHSSGLLNWRFLNDDEKLDFKFDPGTRYVYSGEGIQIMQLIVEEKTGKPLAELMQKRVFDRFGMKNTSMMWRPDFAGHVANGYDGNGKKIGHAHRSHSRAAGSMDTTLDDYARFLAGALRGDGLSEAARKEMLSPQIAIVSPQQFPSHWPGSTDVNRKIGLSYGLGWGIYQSPHGRAFFKEGHDDGTNNIALGFLDSRSGILMLCNSSNGESMFFYAIESILGQACLPWFWMGYIPYDRPDLRKPEARNNPIPPCQNTE